MSVSKRFPTEKALGLGVALAGGVILFQALTGKIGAGEQTGIPGQFGGADDPEQDYAYVPITPQTDNPNDPYDSLIKNSSSPIPTTMIDLSGAGYENPYAMQTQALPEGFKVIVDQSGNIMGYEDPIAQQTKLGDPFADPTSSINVIGADAALWNPYAEGASGKDDRIKALQDDSARNIAAAAEHDTGLFGSDITLPQYSLGVLGVSGSYFSAFGSEVVKRSDDVGVSLLKRTYDVGVESIPFIGKKAVKKAIKFGAGEVAEQGAGYGLKQITKGGISFLPFLGTVAGAEFDVAVDNRSRGLAYTANIFGDVLGGGAVALGGLTGLSQTGFGAAALGIGGQMGGEQAVYRGADKVRNLFTGLKNAIMKPMIPIVQAAPGEAQKPVARAVSENSVSYIDAVGQPAKKSESKSSSSGKKISGGGGTSVKTKIVTSIKKYSGGGYSDTKMKQSITKKEAKKRIAKRTSPFL